MNLAFAQRSLEDLVSLRLAGDADAPAAARDVVWRLRGELDRGLVETMRLLVTELVTNSVRHARAPAVDLEVRVTAPVVRVEVHDPGPGFSPGQPRRSLGGDGGWGLVLVERLADRWGVSGEPGDTRVWLELDRKAA
jgi:anti-sigma regulatory factor (Ser/Thr protein kinase)